MVKVGGSGEGGDSRRSLPQGGGRKHGQQLFPVPSHDVQGAVGAVLSPPTNTALLNIRLMQRFVI
jgi:hypothetical protein